jgi:glycosyltransferase involved in cell wall biosynthesis
LVKAGHRVFVVTTGIKSGAKNQFEIEQCRETEQCPNYIFTKSPSGKYSKDWFCESVRACNEILLQHKIDVLISQSSAGIEVFKKMPDIKKIAISHGTSFGEWQTRFKTVRSVKDLIRLITKDTSMAILGWWEDYRLFSLSDKVVCVSELVKDRLGREFSMFKEKLAVIDNGVDLEKFKMQNSKSKVNSDFILLYVGRVVKEKGLEVLFTTLSNLKMLKGLKLLVVGGGKDFERYKNLVKSQDLPVTFYGEVKNEETIKYYKKADVFILPTLRQEGFPMVLVEAMATGLPIIASRIGGIPSAVTDGENGILVSPNSVAELREAIKLLYENSGLRKLLSDNSRILSEKKYGQEAMIKRYLSIVDF